jgi:hypothetical protein
MPITINGSGTVTGISAGGLPDDCITTAEIAAAAVTTAKLGSSEASGLAKAWVNFNGTGTVAIRASFNVSSITDNGVGNYTVNFTTAMADTNYSYQHQARATAANYLFAVSQIGSTKTTSALQFQAVQSTAGVETDSSELNVAIFR